MAGTPGAVESFITKASSSALYGVEGRVQGLGFRNPGVKSRNDWIMSRLQGLQVQQIVGKPKPTQHQTSRILTTRLIAGKSDRTLLDLERRT